MRDYQIKFIDKLKEKGDLIEIEKCEKLELICDIFLFNALQEQVKEKGILLGIYEMGEGCMVEIYKDNRIFYLPVKEDPEKNMFFALDTPLIGRLKNGMWMGKSFNENQEPIITLIGNKNTIEIQIDHIEKIDYLAGRLHIKIMKKYVVFYPHKERSFFYKSKLRLLDMIWNVFSFLFTIITFPFVYLFYKVKNRWQQNKSQLEEIEDKKIRNDIYIEESKKENILNRERVVNRVFSLKKMRKQESFFREDQIESQEINEGVGQEWHYIGSWRHKKNIPTESSYDISYHKFGKGQGSFNDEMIEILDRSTSTTNLAFSQKGSFSTTSSYSLENQSINSSATNISIDSFHYDKKKKGNLGKLIVSLKDQKSRILGKIKK